MTDLYAILTPIGETTMSNDNLFCEITSAPILCRDGFWLEKDDVCDIINLRDNSKFTLTGAQRHKRHGGL